MGAKATRDIVLAEGAYSSFTVGKADYSRSTIDPL